MKILVNIDVPEFGPTIALYSTALGLAHRRALDNHNDRHGRP
ncbi:hypothetical protein SAMN02745148_00593 [Modicisalibacter ilicicola DSM 19980]|uniref:Uncharacterized protein n=1 Tax=Modicisalibacter ilicicola DSM 19980 TaxID=1121942 RepID=A0A1M4UDY4_9GAMM|nr:hypothetical protein SAMN02745148_00593 [Halomonas ilicicola DSM 19980]